MYAFLILLIVVAMLIVGGLVIHMYLYRHLSTHTMVSTTRRKVSQPHSELQRVIFS